MNDKMLLTELKAIENRMDFINGKNGDKFAGKTLCIFCGSKEYDSKKGVIHFPGCALLQVRFTIKKMEIENGTKSR